MSGECGDIKYIKCSKCKCKYINDDEHIKSDFGFNRLNKIFKTCVKCRSKNKINKINDGDSNKILTLVEYYVTLPLIKLEKKQDKDMRIDAIVVLNHSVEFEPAFRRCDNQECTYKEFTKLDSVEYEEGTDPMLDYMPDEYVAPVLMRIDGITYRASCLTWFPLTNCVDAIRLRQYEQKRAVYPIYVKAGQCPVVTITNATGYNYHERLPKIGHSIKLNLI
jgi:hypothetical protein